MDSKRLIIAFFAVSLAALCVSCAAVISVARTYNSMLAKEETSSEPADTPETSGIIEITDIIESPDLTEPEEDITVSLPEDVTTEAAAEEITTEESAVPALFTLLIDGDRLVILSPDGKRVYERIIDTDRMHPKDLELLLEGIPFDTLDDAMSAVYDVIS